MHRIARSLALVLTPFVVLALGCTDTGELAGPSADRAEVSGPLFTTTSSSPDLIPLATFDKRPTITIAWAKKWIGPEGGRLDFQGFAIDVPAGAVSKVTQFSIHLPVDPNASERVLAKFGPHGATFDKPVAIEFPFAGTSIAGSSTATVVWWNDTWVDVGGAPTADGARLRTTTDHFSDYGTTDTSLMGGTISASGG